MNSGQKFMAKTVELELGEALTQALGHGHGMDDAAMEAKKVRLELMFKTMPRNAKGRVGRDAMHYMAQRYFGSEYGWSLKGFDPPSQKGASSSSPFSRHDNMNVSDEVVSTRDKHAVSKSFTTEIMKEKLSSYVESVLEKRLDHEGFGLNDLVTLVVVLERLVYDEMLSMLEDAYKIQRKGLDRVLGRLELLDVTVTYMLLYAFEADRRNRSDFPVTLNKIRHGYPHGWPSGQYAIAETNRVLKSVYKENPFAAADRPGYSFDVAAASIQAISSNYGKWTTAYQCSSLKNALVELDPGRTGRVPLIDFYLRNNVSGNWFLEERTEYLRDTGALDETSSTKGPQLIIPNYIQGPSNCLEVSSFYSVCCLKECDSLFGQIEQAIQAPVARPARILRVVQDIINAQHLNPQNLSSLMVSRLEEVAEHHGGYVPLHGRLFAQWLHYAFPHQCPYPVQGEEQASFHVYGVASVDYLAQKGMRPMLSRKEYQDYISENIGYTRFPENTNFAARAVGAAAGPLVLDPLDALDVHAEEVPEEDQDSDEDQKAKEEEERMAQWTMDEELYAALGHQ